MEGSDGIPQMMRMVITVMIQSEKTQEPYKDIL
jgi:hypothetical protein